MSEPTLHRRALVVKVDGLDGCGKTTLLKSLQSIYSTRFKVLSTSEFGSDLDNIAEKVCDRNVSVSRLLNRLAKCLSCDLDDVERELLWAVASRRANRIVIPRNLYLFDLILVDRSDLGNLAYGPVLDPRLELVFQIATTPVEIADIVLWIDTPVETCQSRLLERSHRDVIESKGVNFFNEVKKRYEYLAANRPNIKRLDGTESIESLAARAIDIFRTEGGLDLNSR
jgi:thymidylate kinase